MDVPCWTRPLAGHALPGVVFFQERIMKLPLAVVFILALVTTVTITICLSGAVTRRDTEYGSVRAVLHHYVEMPGMPAHSSNTGIPSR